MFLVHGGWSEWVDGPCSKTCSVGVMKRTRNCSNPEPTCGGNPCFGVDEVEAECLVAECDRELPLCKFELYTNKPCMHPGYVCMKHFCYTSTPACREPDAAFLAERPGILISEEDGDINMTATLVFNESHIEFQHGTRLPYRCQSGYQYDDSVTNIPNLVCMNGVWSGGHKCTGIMFVFVAYKTYNYVSTVLVYTAQVYGHVW